MSALIGPREARPSDVIALDPKAGSLLADLMERNAREAEWAAEQSLKWQEEKTAEWKARALVAEERLARIEDALRRRQDARRRGVAYHPGGR